MAERRIGYIGVDVLNNATICNEALGLLGTGLPLEIVSVHPVARPTFWREESVSRLQPESLYPLGAARVLGGLASAPLVFGGRFWSALFGAFTCPVEGWRQRLRVIAHFLPAICLALRWRKRSIGHIHAHWAHTATTIAMHTACLLGVGFSFTGHANDLFVYRVGLVGKLRRARFVVAISEYHRRFYLDLGADARRLSVVYCGIDLERMGSSSPRDDYAAERPTIVSVGRLVEKKGFHHLIEACARLRDRGVPFRSVIAGSGPEESALRGLVQRHRLEDLVTLPGKNVLQEELAALLGSADLFALPCVRDRDGDMDGLPQVLIEAMVCQLPVVSTQLVGIPDLVRDGENGILVSPGDVAALTDALERLVRDPELRQKYGEAGQQWARAHFGRDETVRRLRCLFEWCAAHPGNEPPDIFPPAPGSEEAYRLPPAPVPAASVTVP